MIDKKGFHFKNYKYNIIPLNFPGPSEAIVELPEVLHFTFDNNISTYCDHLH